MTTDDALDRDTMNRDKLNKEINKLIDQLRKTMQNEQVVGLMMTSLIATEHDATEHDDKLTVVSAVQYTVPAKLTALLMQSAVAFGQATLQSLHEAATMADEEPTGDSQIILPSSRKLDS